MPGCKVTEWDDNDAGGHAFELLDEGKRVYVVRHSDGTFTHMDSRFVTIQPSEGNRNRRQACVTAYMTEHAQSF